MVHSYLTFSMFCDSGQLNSLEQRHEGDDFWQQQFCAMDFLGFLSAHLHSAINGWSAHPIKKNRSFSLPRFCMLGK